MTPRMSYARAVVRVVLPTLVLATFHACRLATYEVELRSLAVSPGDSRIAGTTTQQFSATARYSDDQEMDVTAEAVWTSSDPAVATVSSAGVATPGQSGTTTITASVQGRSASATLTVTNAQLQSIEVTPANASIANGTRQQFTAMGRFDDDSSQDLTADVTWTSSDPAVSFGLAPGLATSTALMATSPTITAALGPISGSTVLTVKAVTLSSISVSPASPTVKLGQVQQFEASGSFSDGSTQGMTHEVTWASSATSVATIGPTGRATAVFAGTTTISATSSALLGSVAGATQLTVQTAGGGY